MKRLLSVLAAFVLAFTARAQFAHTDTGVAAFARVSHVMDSFGLYQNMVSSYNYPVFGATWSVSSRPGEGGYYEKAFNYPSAGLGISYARMGSLQFKGSSRLGDLFNLYGWLGFDWIRSGRFRMGPVLELGIAYSPVAYDWKTNPDNKFIGAHVEADLGAGLEMELLLSQHFSLLADVHATHHSNGMTKAPNWGINELAAGGGVRYYLTERTFVPGRTQPWPDTPEFGKGLHWNFYGSLAVHNCPVELDGVLAAGLAEKMNGRVPSRLRAQGGVEMVWRYSPVWATGLGLEGGYVANNYRETDLRLGLGEDPKGYSSFQSGLSVLQEIWYRQLSLEVALGVYVFKKSGLSEDIPWNFQKVGIRYHWGHCFAGLHMRAHFFDRSYTLEWTVGYSL